MSFDLQSKSRGGWRRRRMQRRRGRRRPRRHEHGQRETHASRDRQQQRAAAHAEHQCGFPEFAFATAAPRGREAEQGELLVSVRLIAHANYLFILVHLHYN